MTIFDPETIDTEEVFEDNESVLYLLSSKYGLGHASRAVAIAQHLGETLPITFAADERVYDFMDDQLGDSGVQYKFVPISYDKDMPKNVFWDENKPVLKRAKRAAMVINDFLVQVPYVREYLSEHDIRKMLVGIYHSIDGYDSESAGVAEYREKYRVAAKVLDFLFLAQPKEEYQPPYALPEGTLVIPCSPVVRSITKTEQEVKAELGLAEDEDFILIQGGMMGNKQLQTAITSLAQMTIQGVRRVFVPYRMPYDHEAMEATDTVVIPARFDAHNLVAASSGLITKPGMQIICEAIAYQRPILTVDDADPERQLKIAMLGDILGEDLPYFLDVDTSMDHQIEHWRAKSQEIIERFARVDCNGAREISQVLIAAHRMEKTQT